MQQYYNKMFKKSIKRVLNYFGYELKKNQVSINAFDYNKNSNVNKFYSSKSAISKYYDKARIDSFKEIINIIKPKINTKSIILDAGCGAGWFTNMVTNEFNNSDVTGFDHSEVAIQYAKNRYPNVKYQTYDLHEDLPDKYDLIFCFSVLEHLEYPKRVVQNFANSIVNTGCIILVVPNGKIDTFEGHIHFWSPESWELFLDDCLPNNKRESFLLKSKAEILTIIY
jgi:2-polyprenyl-3-methyl-5-hydroxy-6-metoxy-1,4-benzoquinol methylase